MSIKDRAKQGFVSRRGSEMILLRLAYSSPGFTALPWIGRILTREMALTFPKASDCRYDRCTVRIVKNWHIKKHHGGKEQPPPLLPSEQTGGAAIILPSTIIRRSTRRSSPHQHPIMCRPARRRRYRCQTKKDRPRTPFRIIASLQTRTRW